jgi:hypothetical protein
VVTGDDLAGIAATRAMLPSRKELAGSFPIVDDGRGNWRATDVPLGAAKELMLPALRKRKELTQAKLASVPRETLLDENGKAFSVEARFAREAAVRRGLVAPRMRARHVTREARVRRYFPCGHYTDRGAQACGWCG